MKTYTVTLIVPLLFCAAAAAAGPGLAEFDEDVAQCRRVLRQSCGIVQALASNPAGDETQRTKALGHLADARIAWQGVIDKYRTVPPPEYARDRQFPHRLQDIAAALEDMEGALQDGAARRSLLACGFGCGLFVKMHAENGLAYVLDELFHMRQTAKTARELAITKGATAVRALLPRLMEQRNRVVLAENPWPPEDARHTAFIDAAGELSVGLDGLARDLSEMEPDRIAPAIDTLVVQINKAYGIAL